MMNTDVIQRQSSATNAQSRRSTVKLALQGATMRFRFVSALILLVCCLYAPAASAQQVAATPPMGWNSWNHFAEKVNVAVVRAAADALVSSGMRDAGYVYVNIDDT